MDEPAINWKFFDALMNYRSEALKTAVESTFGKLSKH